MNAPLHSPRKTRQHTKNASRMLVLAAALSSSLSASAGIWTHLGSDLNWSTSANWSNNGSQSGAAVIFRDSAKTTEGTVNNIVSANISIASLSYANQGATSSDWHVTEIAADTTLTITGNLVTGTSGNTMTQAAITGGGKLSMTNSASGIIYIRSTNSSAQTLAKLDMSGLNQFEANVSTIQVGAGNNSQGIWNLAQSNDITATSMKIGISNGDSQNNTTPSEVNLGAANLLKIDDIYVGADSRSNRFSGILQFQNLDGDEPSTVTIRGSSGGNSRANLTVGNHFANTGIAVTALADFTGGSVDARFNEVLIASGAGSGSGHMTGRLAMKLGTIDATSIVVGRTITGSTTATQTTGTLEVDGGELTVASLTLAQNQAAAGKVTGNLNISGGVVNATGGVVMGEKAGTSGTINAIVNLSGGKLESGANIAEGAGGTDTVTTIRSTFNLTGGTLDMTGHTVTVDTFNAEQGTIENLGAITTSAGTGFTKTTGGTLTLGGSNAYTGTTRLQAGVLLVDGDLINSAIEASADTVLGGTGTIRGAVTLAGNNTFQSAGTLTLRSALNIDTAGNQISGGTVSFQGETTIAEGVTFTNNGVIGGGGDLIIEGTLAGTGAINKTGGTVSGSGSLDNDLVFSGSSTLGSVTLNKAFTLNGAGNQVDGSATVTGTTTVNANSTLTVNEAATLSGVGSLLVSGALNGSGTVQKDVTTSFGGSVGGGLTIEGSVGGSGAINPGNSPGILTATQLNPEEGIALNLEFTTKNAPFNWDSVTNDVVRLTGETPFTMALSVSNTISLYLSEELFSGLSTGDFVVGGIYADAGFSLSDVQNVSIAVYRQDASGSILYNGDFYSVDTSGVFSISVISDAQFGANGRITQFTYTAVPEPQSALLILVGSAAAGWAMNRRRSNAASRRAELDNVA